VFCPAHGQRTAALKWIFNVGFKENEDVDIRLAAAGCTFLAWKIWKEENKQETCLGDASIA
jgi:hypothetical protein